MSQIFVTGVGAVLSADAAVPDHEREMRFYSRVLGTGESPLWREGDLLNNLGIPIIGLGARTDDHARLPLQWMPHIQVANVAESVRRAEELGGEVRMQARAEDGTTHWAVLLDPNGAAFGIIPVVPAGALPPIPSAGAEDAPVGRIQWVDLTVPDAPTTRDFYARVVGWTARNVEMKDGDAEYADYSMVGEAGSPTAGVCHARGANAALPPVWLLYLPVGDLEESLRRVEEEGGKVVASPRGKDGRYAYAAVRDPVGMHVALVQADAPA